MSRSVLIGFLVLCILSLGVLAGELAEKQLLRISLDASDLGGLDPHYAGGTHDRILHDMIYNGLLRYAPGEFPNIEPDLAIELPEQEIVDGKQVWTFHLRKGVMTHPFADYPDGYELTSEDVLYSLSKAADPARSAWAGDYKHMSFEAPDKYTVKIIVDSPMSSTLFLPLVADYQGGFIIPKKACEEIGDEKFKTNPVGTGPFKFVQYFPMEKVLLRAHEAYFRGKPIIEEIQGLYIGDVSAAEMALLSGEVEAVIGPTEQPWVEKMEAHEGVTVDIFGPGENVSLHYNVNKAPMDDIRVRKAIAYSLARSDMTGMFGDMIGSETYSLIPFGFMAGALSETDLQKAVIPWEIGPDDQNLEKAKAILKEAGYENGLALEAYTSQRAYYLKPFTLVQESLRQIGVQLKITTVDHATYHNLIRQDANHLVFYNVWRPTPDIYLTRFYHSASEVVEGTSPDTNFSHSDMVDELIEKARYELNGEEQERLWKEAQIALARNVMTSAFCILRLTCARLDVLDWGHPVKAAISLYPQVTEHTKILKPSS
jgi:peptide/nickel transport system substrate-binding protein